MHNNGMSTPRYWYIPLPPVVRIRRKNRRTPENLEHVIPVPRPTLYWVLFFVGLANLAKTQIVIMRLHGSAIPLTYISCGLVSAGAAKIALKLDERTRRAVTSLLGLGGITYNTLSMSGGPQTTDLMIVTGSIAALNLLSEAGYLLSRRAHRSQTAERTARRAAKPAEISADNPEQTTTDAKVAASPKQPRSPKAPLGKTQPARRRNRRPRRTVRQPASR